MRKFVESTLQSNRDAVDRSKEIKADIHADPNSELKPNKTVDVRDNNTMSVMNEDKKELNKNAVAVIVNEDNKILLLKRSDYPDSWMPNKWALVGGGIDKGETPENAIKREVKEETGLEIDDFINAFTIQRHKESIETVFTCRYKGDPTDITLDKENTNYGWFSVAEIEFLDIVPHLIEYVTLIFKKYE
jgi:8-oxo-dGTP diphosphatase